MQHPAYPPWIAAVRFAALTLSTALTGGIVVTPATVSLSRVQVPAVQLTVAGENITLDLVRHGQSTDNVDGILGTVAPGAPLTDLGQLQAHDVAALIHAEFPGGVGGIYASNLLRAQETAVPLAQLLNEPAQINPGLNEVNAGMLEGNQLNVFTDIGYLLPQVMWVLGFRFVPMLGSAVDPNGMAFDNRVDDAVQTIYDNTVTSDGPSVDVAFAHAGVIAVWALMNVKNPDFGVVLKELIDTHVPLSNTGQVVIEGSPQEGWTLLSWDGTDVPQTPNLGTELFVAARDLIVAPQTALWQLWESIAGVLGGGLVPLEPGPVILDEPIG